MRSLAVTALVMLTSGVSVASPDDCRDGIVAAGARYAQATVKAVAACVRRHVGDCASEPRTVAKRVRAVTRLRAAIAARCCGADRACGTGDDDPLASVGFGAFCPNLDRGDCNMPIANAGDAATCLACIADAAAFDVAGLVGVPAPADAGAARCAASVAKESARFAVTASKALARCWDARAAGRHMNACPTPGDGLAGPAIAAAATRATAAMCKACGGADRACGGGDDVAPAAIGFPAACPSVSVPEGAACAGDATTLTGLVACVGCVTNHASRCADAAAAPGFVSYPSECADPPGTCSAGVECVSAADCPAGYACLDNGSHTTRYCVGPSCVDDAGCDGGAVCRQYCTFAGCAPRRCVCPGFACGQDEVCIDDGGLACRQLCTQDSDCPPPLGVCVNSTFDAGLCISSTPCQ